MSAVGSIERCNRLFTTLTTCAWKLNCNQWQVVKSLVKFHENIHNVIQTSVIRPDKFKRLSLTPASSSLWLTSNWCQRSDDDEIHLNSNERRFDFGKRRRNCGEEERRNRRRTAREDAKVRALFIEITLKRAGGDRLTGVFVDDK